MSDKIKYLPTDTVDEIMAKAEMNWEVQHVDCFMDWGGKKEKIARKALVRSDNGHLLTVTSPKWKPVLNRDVVAFFHRVIQQSGAELISIGEVKGGKGIWAQCDIKSGFELKGGDKVQGNVVFCSWHEVGKSTIAATSARRLWCQNQLAAALRKSTGKYKQSHIADFNFDRAMEAISNAKDEIVDFSKQAEKLTKVKMSEEEAHKFLAKHFVGDDVSAEALDALIKDESQQPLALKQVLHSYVKAPGANPGTGWGVLNAVTHWADHVAGNKPATRFERAMFGDNAKLKTELMNDLLELA
jgi:phage/plasmid-like protein (TIGR03299 family)